jgi:ComEC/Rec2-related protein
VEEPFQQTGTLHLFAVAGLHVGIVAQLLWILARLARVPRRTATVLIIVALLFYSAVTGLHTSSVRASIMAAVLLAGFLVERKVFALNSLAAAAVIILCWNTNELFSIGFQMSFAVVTAIVLFTEPTFHCLLRIAAPDPFLPRSLFSRVQRTTQTIWWWFARGLSVSFGAWIGSLVPMYAYWNLITPISLVANLAVVPIAFFVLAGALVSIIAAPFSAWLSIVFNNANWLLTRAVLALVNMFAQVPTGHCYLEHPHRPTHALVDITALDVGTGGAIHLRTAQRDWLIDAGARRDFDRTVRQYLRYRGTNRLDDLVLTHADSNHVGGASDVIDAFDPRLILNTAARSRSRTNRSLESKVGNEGLPHATAARGDEYRLSGRVTARVLFPPRDFEASSADDQAIVLQLLVDGKPRVLLMSDSGEATERALLTNPSELRADVVIKGQHRSGISGTAEFLDAVRPQLIIATSRDFPENERLKEEWVAMVESRGIKLLRQDLTGAVRLLIFRDRWQAVPYLTSQTLRSTSR